MVKLSGNRLRLSSGKVVKFKSARKRARYEKVAKAVKHGFRPTRRSGRTS